MRWRQPGLATRVVPVCASGQPFRHSPSLAQPTPPRSSPIARPPTRPPLLASSLQTSSAEQNCAPALSCLLERTIWESRRAGSAAALRQLRKSSDAQEILGALGADARPAKAAVTPAYGISAPAIHVSNNVSRDESPSSAPAANSALGAAKPRTRPCWLSDSGDRFHARGVTVGVDHREAAKAVRGRYGPSAGWAAARLRGVGGGCYRRAQPLRERPDPPSSNPTLWRSWAKSAAPRKSLVIQP